MKRAYIENVPHNFEAHTITVSDGNHWAGGGRGDKSRWAAPDRMTIQVILPWLEQQLHRNQLPTPSLQKFVL